MMDRTWMKKCCEHCPFRRGTSLVLHPDRAEDFAYMASNPYSDFPCHKTADYAEESEYREGGFVHGEHSFTCHGFKGIQVSENDNEPDFVSDGQHFYDSWDMICHHEDEYEKQFPGRAAAIEAMDA